MGTKNLNLAKVFRNQNTLQSHIKPQSNRYNAHDCGETVALTTIAVEGRRRFTGVLLGITDGNVELDCDGEKVAIAFDQVKKCTLKPDFSKLSSKENK